MEYHTATRMHGSSLYVAIVLDLDSIILSDKSELTTVMHRMIPFFI